MLYNHLDKLADPPPEYSYDPNDLVFVVDTTLSAGTTVYVPPLTTSGGLDVVIDWGDGSSDSYTTSGDKSHTYSIEGEYVISISGTMGRLGDGTIVLNPEKITKCLSFGALGINYLNRSFFGCVNLNECPSTLPSTVQIMNGVFRDCINFNSPNVGSWDTSNVTSMIQVFFGCASFNSSLLDWDFSSCTSISGLFAGCSVFNQPLGSWDVSTITDFSSLFTSAYSFNQDISSWNTASAINFESMFYNASAFNQPLNSWEVGNCIDFGSMFRLATSFNQSLSSWDVSSGVDFDNMFLTATAFNQDISLWDVSGAQNTQAMFQEASAFNQDLSSWNTFSSSNMTNMFAGATSFSQDLSDWNVPLIGAEPSGFNGSGGVLSGGQKPVWGTAPRCTVSGTPTLVSSGVRYDNTVSSFSALTGDLAVAFCYRDSSSSLPGNPSGYNLVRSGTNGSTSFKVLAKEILSDGVVSSSTSSNATATAYVLLRGIDVKKTLSILNNAHVDSSTTTSLTVSASNLVKDLGVSIVFAGSTSANPDLMGNVGTTDLTYETGLNGGTGEIAVFSKLTPSTFNGGSINMGTGNTGPHTAVNVRIVPNLVLTE